jgi:hypothetical protein
MSDAEHSVALLIAGNDALTLRKYVSMRAEHEAVINSFSLKME